MMITDFLNALNNLEAKVSRLHRYELRLTPDGSGSIFGVFNPQIPAAEAVYNLATNPQLYEAQVSFDNLQELEQLRQQMLTDPESIEWTLIEK